MDNPCDKIFLIGFMGSGKSTVGRKLAARLKWKFIDLDEEIERSAGLKIPEIFSVKGESFFREAESEELRKAALRSRSVISTGGGTPCSENNMKLMLESGLTVYLKMSPEQLMIRLAGSTGERPLLKHIPEKELSGFIKNKLSEREKWYDQAAITCAGCDIDLNGLLSKIKSCISM